MKSKFEIKLLSCAVMAGLAIGCGGSAPTVKEPVKPPPVDTAALTKLSPSQAPVEEPKVKVEAEELFKKGVEAYRAKDSSRAMDFFEESVDVDASLSEAYFNIGLIHWEKGDEDEAKEWFAKAQAKGNKVADGLALQGAKKLAEGDQMVAMNLFRQAVAIDPFNAPANLNLAQDARARGDFKGARRLVRTALKQDGKNPAAYAVLARIYYDQSRLVLAKLVCQSGLELDKQSARLHNTLGLIHLKEDDQKRAIRDFVRATEAEPTFVAAKLNLGAVALRYKDYQLAYTQFANAVKLEPKNQMAILSYGVAARSLGKLEEAEAQYQKVLSINAEHVGALYNQAVLEADYKKNYEASLKLLTRVQQLESNDQALLKRVANRIEVLRIQIETAKEMEAAKQAESAAPAATEGVDATPEGE